MMLASHVADCSYVHQPTKGLMIIHGEHIILKTSRVDRTGAVFQLFNQSRKLLETKGICNSDLIVDPDLISTAKNEYSIEVPPEGAAIWLVREQYNGWRVLLAICDRDNHREVTQLVWLCK